MGTILDAFENAKAAKLYDAVEHCSGEKRRAYAMVNEMEYFASLCVPYFYGRNDYYPFIRPELQEYDPAAFSMLEEVWGILKTPDITEGKEDKVLTGTLPEIEISKEEQIEEKTLSETEVSKEEQGEEEVLNELVVESIDEQQTPDSVLAAPLPESSDEQEFLSGC